MFTFLSITCGFLTLFISLFVLAFGDTQNYKKLRKHWSICSFGKGLCTRDCKDPCFEYISEKLTDKCKVLPFEIEELNRHLQHITEIQYFTEEIYKCYMPNIQALKCQLVSNAKEIVPIIQSEILALSPPLLKNDACNLDVPCAETPQSPEEQSLSPIEISFSPLTSPASHCSLSDKDDETDIYPPCQLEHIILDKFTKKIYCEKCFENSAIDQALKFLCEAFKQGCD